MKHRNSSRATIKSLWDQPRIEDHGYPIRNAFHIWWWYIVSNILWPVSSWHEAWIFSGSKKHWAWMKQNQPGAFAALENMMKKSDEAAKNYDPKHSTGVSFKNREEFEAYFKIDPEKQRQEQIQHNKFMLPYRMSIVGIPGFLIAFILSMIVVVSEFAK